MKVSAVIVAAGSGKRMGAGVKKQFLELHGKPILFHTVSKYQECDTVDEIIIVLPAIDFAESAKMVCNWPFSKIEKCVPGGAERHESVMSGLSAVSRDIEIVAIHDGVRPFIKPNHIEKTINKAEKYGAAILTVKPKETIKVQQNGQITKTLVRDELVVVQTPQTFKFDLIQTAYQKAVNENFISTDDAAVAEYAGYTVHCVEGDYDNIKITSPEDLKLAEILIQK